MDGHVLYHGSENIIERPAFGAGNARNDYGLGFYCTEHPELAKEWACAENRDGFSNEYSIDMKGLTVLDLSNCRFHILNWMAILLENRTFVISQGIAYNAREYILRTFIPEYEDDVYFTFSC